MGRLDSLKNIKSKQGLAKLLGIKPSSLTYTLYILKTSSQYTSFPISKKSGGVRTITAPSDRLKLIQSKLSDYLQDCIEEINRGKTGSEKFQSTLSHGFARNKTIITNAMMHLHRKNVLNIDLKDFFDSFNFGRVRGFFIKNRNFELDPHVATVIAQIACHENKLPQGSPCSPVITNLICHALDIRLAKLASKHSCVYTRYADDITISTRERDFPAEIMAEEDGRYTPGKKLHGEIERAGFFINPDKTRIQYKDSRQDVTGLVVNKKPNVKKEYWRIVKSQCNELFKSGMFLEETDHDFEQGNVYRLEGKLNFIDQLDSFNRTRDKPPLVPDYKIEKHGHNTWTVLNGREKTFSRFLYYKYFYGNAEPTIICEGKTDNVYLKAAINTLVAGYPELAKAKTQAEPYKLLIRFFEYTKRTRFLLQLYGGTSYLNYFIGNYENKQSYYKAPKPKSPVILVLDNDSGCKDILNKVSKLNSSKYYKNGVESTQLKSADFIYVLRNLYIVLTPLGANDEDTAIEDLFDVAARRTVVSGKVFNPKDDKDLTKEYGKEIFARKVIQAQKTTINFSGLRPVLDRIVMSIRHYDTIQ